ncbi:MAG TPA: hypothetical protein VMT20_20890 [Terriglobia bacterium]|nr:hypothetical protein [Terriglobia bacterium]
MRTTIDLPDPPFSKVKSLGKRLSQSAQAGTRFWTDAYIAAPAPLHNHRVVSFDKGFGRIAGLDSTVL